MKLILAFAILISFTLSAESTITITLVNRSRTSFKVERLEAVQGAKLVVDVDNIAPGASAKIEGTIFTDVDLDGSVYFNKDAHRFHVNVRRLKHFGQPVFFVHGEGVQSRIDRESLKFNSDGIPTHLSHTAVTVFIL